VVPKVVEAILNLPENTHLAVRHTSILLLGELCEWINSHPQSLGIFFYKFISRVRENILLYNKLFYNRTNIKSSTDLLESTRIGKCSF
jgi:hypothetical protein